MSNELITVTYQNTRGLNSKTHEFFKSVSNCECQRIAVTETWLQDGVYNHELFNDNYVLFRKDRRLDIMDVTRGGGVLLGVRHDITASKVDLSVIEDLIPVIDILGCKLHFFITFYMFLLFTCNLTHP